MANRKLELEEMMAQMRTAEEKAWWWEMTKLVGSKDQPLAVIGPRADATNKTCELWGRPNKIEAEDKIFKQTFPVGEAFSNKEWTWK